MLRQRTVDLFEAAAELRDDEIPDAKATITELEAWAEANADDPADIPNAKEREYQQAKQRAKELVGTAETYEHYAEAWSADGDTCEFVLEELNGDEYAKVVDTFSAEATKQARQDGSIPEGLGRVTALEFGVEDVPAECPPDPGAWPAPIVTLLYQELESLTAPQGVELGNESLASCVRPDETVTADGGDPPDGA